MQQNGEHLPGGRGWRMRGSPAAIMEEMHKVAVETVAAWGLAYRLEAAGEIEQVDEGQARQRLRLSVHGQGQTSRTVAVFWLESLQDEGVIRLRVPPRGEWGDMVKAHRLEKEDLHFMKYIFALRDRLQEHGFLPPSERRGPGE
ncbi:MAG: hypothetical protein HY686_02750 [Chloroflexi bacterium]|nr:hypothetical protein [Chloroflexota bacterium]